MSKEPPRSSEIAKREKVTFFEVASRPWPFVANGPKNYINMALVFVPSTP